jgi:hypothetical protein
VQQYRPTPRGVIQPLRHTKSVVRAGPDPFAAAAAAAAYDDDDDDDEEPPAVAPTGAAAAAAAADDDAGGGICLSTNYHMITSTVVAPRNSSVLQCHYMCMNSSRALSELVSTALSLHMQKLSRGASELGICQYCNVIAFA